MRCSPPVRDEQVRLGRPGHRQVARQMRLINPFRVRGQIRFGRQHRARGLQDVPASAVIGRHGEVQAVIVGGALLRRENEFRSRGSKAERSPITCNRTPCSSSLPTSRSSAWTNSRISRETFGGTPPVLGAEREQRQVAHAGAPAGLDHAPDGLHALGVSRRGQQTRRPPAVAVHDDGDVLRVSRVSGTACGNWLPWSLVPRAYDRRKRNTGKSAP